MPVSDGIEPVTDVINMFNTWCLLIIFCRLLVCALPGLRRFLPWSGKATPSDPEATLPRPVRHRRRPAVGLHVQLDSLAWFVASLTLEAGCGLLPAFGGSGRASGATERPAQPTQWLPEAPSLRALMSDLLQLRPPKKHSMFR